MKLKRWTVTITYDDDQPTDEAGRLLTKQVLQLEEVEELQDILEHGPDWKYLDEVTITYNFKERDRENG